MEMKTKTLDSIYKEKVARLQRLQKQTEKEHELVGKLLIRYSPLVEELPIPEERNERLRASMDRKKKAETEKLQKLWGVRHPQVIAINSKDMMETDQGGSQAERRQTSPHFVHTTRLAAWRATRFKGRDGVGPQAEGAEGQQHLQGLTYGEFLERVATTRAHGDFGVVQKQHGGVQRVGGMPLVFPFIHKPVKLAHRVQSSLCEPKALAEAQREVKKPPKKEPPKKEPPKKQPRKRESPKRASRRKPKSARRATPSSSSEPHEDTAKSVLSSQVEEDRSMTSLRSVCSWCSIQARRPVPANWIDPTILKVPRSKNSVWRRQCDVECQTDPVVEVTSPPSENEVKEEWKFLCETMPSAALDAKDISQPRPEDAIPDTEMSGIIRQIITTSLSETGVPRSPKEVLSLTPVREEKGTQSESSYPPEEFSKDQAFAAIQKEETQEAAGRDEKAEKGHEEEKAETEKEVKEEAEEEKEETEEERARRLSLESFVPVYIQGVISSSVNDLQKRLKCETAEEREAEELLDMEIVVESEEVSEAKESSEDLETAEKGLQMEDVDKKETELSLAVEIITDDQTPDHMDLAQAEADVSPTPPKTDEPASEASEQQSKLKEEPVKDTEEAQPVLQLSEEEKKMYFEMIADDYPEMEMSKESEIKMKKLRNSEMDDTPPTTEEREKEQPAEEQPKETAREEETPEEQPKEIAREEETPVEQSKEIAREEETSVEQPEEIAREEETPVEQPEEIAREEEPPVEQPEEIAREEESPVEQAEEIAREEEPPVEQPEEITREEEIPAEEQAEEIAREEEPSIEQPEEIAREEEIPAEEQAEETAREEEIPAEEQAEEIAREEEPPVEQAEEIAREEEPSVEQPEEIAREEEIPAEEQAEEIAREEEITAEEQPEEIAREEEPPVEQAEEIAREEEPPVEQPEEIAREEEITAEEQPEEIAGEEEIPAEEQPEEIAREEEIPAEEQPEEIAEEEEIPAEEQAEEIAREEEPPVEQPEEIAREEEIPAEEQAEEIAREEEIPAEEQPDEISREEEIPAEEQPEEIAEEEEIPAELAEEIARKEETPAKEQSEEKAEVKQKKVSIELLFDDLPTEQLVEEAAEKEEPHEEAHAEEPPEEPHEEVPTEAQPEGLYEEISPEIPPQEVPTEELHDEIPTEIPTDVAVTEARHEEIPTEEPPETLPTEAREEMQADVVAQERYEDEQPEQEPAEEREEVPDKRQTSETGKEETTEEKHEIPAETEIEQETKALKPEEEGPDEIPQETDVTAEHEEEDAESRAAEEVSRPEEAAEPAFDKKSETAPASREVEEHPDDQHMATEEPQQVSAEEKALVQGEEIPATEQEEVEKPFEEKPDEAEVQPEEVSVQDGAEQTPSVEQTPQQLEAPLKQSIEVQAEDKTTDEPDEIIDEADRVEMCTIDIQTGDSLYSFQAGIMQTGESLESLPVVELSDTCIQTGESLESCPKPFDQGDDSDVQANHIPGERSSELPDSSEVNQDQFLYVNQSQTATESQEPLESPGEVDMQNKATGDEMEEITEDAGYIDVYSVDVQTGISLESFPTDFSDHCVQTSICFDEESTSGTQTIETYLRRKTGDTVDKAQTENGVKETKSSGFINTESQPPVAWQPPKEKQYDETPTKVKPDEVPTELYEKTPAEEQKQSVSIEEQRKETAAGGRPQQVSKEGQLKQSPTEISPKENLEKISTEKQLKGKPTEEEKEGLLSTVQPENVPKEKHKVQERPPTKTKLQGESLEGKAKSHKSPKLSEEQNRVRSTIIDIVSRESSLEKYGFADDENTDSEREAPRHHVKKQHSASKRVPKRDSSDPAAQEDSLPGVFDSKAILPGFPEPKHLVHSEKESDADTSATDLSSETKDSENVDESTPVDGGKTKQRERPDDVARADKEVEEIVADAEKDTCCCVECGVPKPKGRGILQKGKFTCKECLSAKGDDEIVVVSSPELQRTPSPSDRRDPEGHDRSASLFACVDF